MAHMAGPPNHRVAHEHEAGNLVDNLILPRRLERGAVTAFMPARIRGRSVQHPVGQPERGRPPTGPQQNPQPGKSHHKPEPQHRVPGGPRIILFHQAADLSRINRCAVPGRVRQACGLSAGSGFLGKGVIACHDIRLKGTQHLSKDIMPRLSSLMPGHPRTGLWAAV